jgi:hypothetical protein
MEYCRDRLIYFAHPINTYNTDIENEAMAIIKSSLNYVILNPNKQEHQDAYAKQGMQYFLDLVTTCVALIAMPFPDGKYGHGVWTNYSKWSIIC